MWWNRSCSASCLFFSKHLSWLKMSLYKDRGTTSPRILLRLWPDLHWPWISSIVTDFRSETDHAASQTWDSCGLMTSLITSRYSTQSKQDKNTRNTLKNNDGDCRRFVFSPSDLSTCLFLGGLAAVWPWGVNKLDQSEIILLNGRVDSGKATCWSSRQRLKRSDEFIGNSEVIFILLFVCITNDVGGLLSLVVVLMDPS